MQAADISYNLFLQYTKWHSIHNSILYQVTKKHVDSQDILVVMSGVYACLHMSLKEDLAMQPRWTYLYIYVTCLDWAD